MARSSLPVANPTDDYTHLEVSVDYDKKYKGPYLFLSLVKVKDGMVSFVLFQNPTGRLALDPTWTRNNTKKLAAVREKVLADIKAGTGPAADLAREVTKSVGGLAAWQPALAAV